MAVRHELGEPGLAPRRKMARRAGSGPGVNCQRHKGRVSQNCNVQHHGVLAQFINVVDVIGLFTIEGVFAA